MSTKAVYIATTEPHSGKSLISLGVMQMFLRKTKRVAVFRPILNESPTFPRDRNIDLLLSHFGLDVDYEETYAYRPEEASDLLARKKYDELLYTIIDKYKALEDRYDFILCIGVDFSGESTAFEFDLNVAVVQSLGCPVILLGRAGDRDVDDTIAPILLALDSFKEKGGEVVATIVNRAPPEKACEILEALKIALPQKDMLVSVIPSNETLASPTVKEIAARLNAEVMYGGDQLEGLVKHNVVVAMQMENYLPLLEENALLITPGDRGEILLSAVLAHRSASYPRLAGVILTTGVTPAWSVLRLLDDFPDILPVLSVKTKTFETAADVGSVCSYITADNEARSALSLNLFEEHIDIDALESRLDRFELLGMSPPMFLYTLLRRARSDKQHIVLPEGTDGRILKAAEYLTRQQIVDLTLLGNETEIRALIGQLGLKFDLENVSIVDPGKSPKLADYAETLFELRKHKGLTRESAQELMHDVSYFGTMMLYKGDVAGMVSGAVHSTLHTIRPALQFVKMRPGFSIVSSVFFMALDDRVLVYGDCAINPNPTAEELAEIAITSAETSHAFGIEPRIAMLSYSSGESGEGKDVDRVRAATRLAQGRRSDLLIEGPIQYDAAVDVGVGRRKMPGSELAGSATVFIFPDLNAGNIAYKAVQREAGGIAVGPVLQGLKKPVNDLSRGCSVDDIINTVAITAIQAQCENTV